MNLDELLDERAVSLAKTVWQKRGDAISRQEVKRMIASDVIPRTQITKKDAVDG